MSHGSGRVPKQDEHTVAVEDVKDAACLLQLCARSDRVAYPVKTSLNHT
jgi:hypothetical protein